MSVIFQVTGSYAGQKAPNLNGIGVLLNKGLTAYSGSTGLALPASTQPVATLGGICGDITNGIAGFSNRSVSYLTGIGVKGATWYKLKDVPVTGEITAICGDMVNGLAATDGVSVWVMLFNGSGTGTWTTLANPPLAKPWLVTDIAGDPTNGILLVMGQKGNPSSLYWGLGTSVEACSCAWIPVTSPGTNLPAAKMSVAQACGTSANGFIIFGDNQFFSLTSVKSTPATPTAAGSCVAAQAKMPSPPFTVTSISGDATNGCTALDSTSGLIATTSNTLASWTVVSVASVSTADDSTTTDAASSSSAPSPTDS